MSGLHEMGDMNASVPKRLNSTNDLKPPRYVFIYKMNAKYGVCNAAKANWASNDILKTIVNAKYMQYF